jgi:hypothetical protein
VNYVPTTLRVQNRRENISGVRERKRLNLTDVHNNQNGFLDGRKYEYFSISVHSKALLLLHGLHAHILITNPKYYSGHHTKEHKTGGACGICGSDQTQRNNLQDLSIEGTFKRILETQTGKAWTGLIWLRIVTRDGLLWTRWWPFRLHKIREISWLAERLSAFRDGSVLKNFMSSDFLQSIQENDEEVTLSSPVVFFWVYIPCGICVPTFRRNVLFPHSGWQCGWRGYRIGWEESSMSAVRTCYEDIWPITYTGAIVSVTIHWSICTPPNCGSEKGPFTSPQFTSAHLPFLELTSTGCLPAPPPPPTKALTVPDFL